MSDPLSGYTADWRTKAADPLAAYTPTWRTTRAVLTTPVDFPAASREAIASAPEPMRTTRLPTIPEARRAAQLAERPFRLGSPTGEQTVEMQNSAPVDNPSVTLTGVARGIQRTGYLGRRLVAMATGNEVAKNTADVQEAIRRERATAADADRSGLSRAGIGLLEQAVPFSLAAGATAALVPEAPVLGAFAPKAIQVGRGLFNLVRGANIAGMGMAAPAAIGGAAPEDVQQQYALGAATELPFGLAGMARGARAATTRIGVLRDRVRAGADEMFAAREVEHAAAAAERARLATMADEIRQYNVPPVQPAPAVRFDPRVQQLGVLGNLLERSRVGQEAIDASLTPVQRAARDFNAQIAEGQITAAARRRADATQAYVRSQSEANRDALRAAIRSHNDAIAEAQIARATAPVAATTEQVILKEPVGSPAWVAAHERMNGFRDAVMEVARTGEAPEQALARFPEARALEAERPGLFAEWVGVKRRQTAAGEPGFTTQDLMVSLAGAGAGATGGGMVGAQMGDTPEVRRRNALIGAGVGLVGGAVIPALAIRPAKPKPPELLPPRDLARPYAATVAQRVVAATPEATNVQALRPQDYVRAEKLGFTEPESISRLHEATAQVIQAARERNVDWRRPVTWAETAQTAQQLSLRPEDLVRRVPERMTFAEMEALKVVAQRADDEIARLSREMGNPELTAGQHLDLENAYDRAWAESRTVIAQFSRARTEAGRSLNILRKIADRPLEPVVWQGIATKMKGAPLSTEEALRVGQLVATGDKAALVRGVASMRPSNFSDKIVTLVKMGYLSRPATHVRNVGSNILNTMIRDVADIPATTLDAIISTATGQRTKSFAGLVGATQRGLADGWQAAKRAMAEGASPETIEGWQLSGRGEFQSPAARAYVEVVGRSLDAEDQLFRRIAFHRALQEEAYTTAWSAGLRGDALKAATERLVAQPTEDIAMVAASAAEEAVFRQRTPLHTLIEGGKQTARRHGYYKTAAAADVVLPFTRTPFAVGATALNYSPVGAARAILLDLPKLVMAANKGSAIGIRNAQRRFVERLSRSVVGSTGFVLVGYQLRKSGVMTGGLPTEPARREQWRTEGKMPYAVRVGARWWGLSGLAPFGTLMAMGASMAETQEARSEGRLRQAAQGVAQTAATVLEQPALQGVARTAEAVSDITGAGARYLENTASGLVPGLVGSVAQAVDPVVRQPENMAQAVAARIPFLSKTVPARRDVFGGEVVRPENFGGRLAKALLDPFSSQADRTVNDPVVAEMQRVGAVLGTIKPRPGEAPAVFRDRQLRTGVLVRRVTEAVTANPMYRNDEFFRRNAERLVARHPDYQGRRVESVVRELRANAIQEAVRSARAAIAGVQ